MPAMDINLNGDNVWPDLQEKEVIHTKETIAVAVLNGGMTSGKPSVAFRINLPDGKVVIAETSAMLFVTAANAINAKFPGLLD